MNDQINNALAEAQKPFADTRFNVCRLEAQVEGGRHALRGVVLDEATLAAVLGDLGQRFPSVDWQTDDVGVLRQAQPRRMVVSTNLTNWQRNPSWLGEQQSQVLNGARIEVLDQNERWTFGRLDDGYLGWAYTGYLIDGERAAAPTHQVSAPIALLRQQPDDRAPLAGRVFAGTRVAAVMQPDGWAEVTLVGGLCGYVPAGALRPLVEELDTAARRARLISDAAAYIGVPYLWGGTTALGIDCSGFAQLMHKLAGVLIPRDADMQFAAGAPVEPPYAPGDLFFYGSPGDHRDISHVAISLGADHEPAGWWRVHSSRSVNGAYIDDMNASEAARRTFKGARRYLLD